MIRVPVDSDTGVVSPYFVNAAGDATNATGTPTCAVVNAAGTTLTAPSVTSSATGLYSAALLSATHCSQPDLLTLTWAGTVSTLARTLIQTVEVANPYRSVPEIRALSNIGTSYTAAQIAAAIREFEETAEDYTGEAYVRRCKALRAPVSQVQGGRLDLGVVGPVDLRSLTVDGTSVSLSTVNVDAHGRLGFAVPPVTYSSTGAGIVAVFEHGRNDPPQAILDACDIFVSSVLKRSTAGVSRDAFMTVQDGVSFRFSTPDKAAGRPTGYIDADRLLNSVPNYNKAWVA